MKQFVKYTSENGTDFLIEVNKHSNNDHSGMRDVGAIERTSEIIEGTRVSFEKSLNGIYNFAETITEKLRELKPNDIEVEFGVTFSAEMGAIITSIGTEANLKITLKWSEKKV